MAKPGKQGQDSRQQYDFDVDRMINEGLAGGYVRPTFQRVQLEETRDIPKNDEPFSTTEETREEK